MSKAAEQIAREFGQLPVADMLARHGRLIQTIQERAEAQGLEPGFRGDIQRRTQEIDAGTVEGVDAMQALKVSQELVRGAGFG